MIKTVRTEYVGGNMWAFFGVLETGEHFIVNDDGYVIIVDMDPQKAGVPDPLLDWNWEMAHTVRDYYWNEAGRLAFCDEMVDWLKGHKAGGLSENELDAYREWFRLPL